jgi:hypothetical protein
MKSEKTEEQLCKEWDDILPGPDHKEGRARLCDIEQLLLAIVGKDAERYASESVANIIKRIRIRYK